MSTREEVEAEIVRHHQVIERWLTGEIDAADFALFETTQAPGFTMVAPGDRAQNRAEVMAEVEAAHGSAPGLRIEISDVRVVAEHGPLIVAAYKEWQHGTARNSTVVLRREGDRLSWLHLHESR